MCHAKLSIMHRDLHHLESIFYFNCHIWVSICQMKRHTLNRCMHEYIWLMLLSKVTYSIVHSSCALYQYIQFNSRLFAKRFFYDTIFAKQLYRKLRFYNRFIFCRNLIYLTYGNIWLILYTVWGVGIISSQVFGQIIEGLDLKLV